MRRGISPVIATVILIAVALVLAVALAGWAMGIWSTMGGTEALQISGVIVRNVTSDNVYVNVTVFNKGTAQANITRVEFIDSSGRLISNSNYYIIVPAGGSNESKKIEFGSTPDVAAGRVYEVRFYTSSGNVYVVPMRCITV